MRGHLRILVCAAVLSGASGAPLDAKPNYVRLYGLLPASINNDGAITGTSTNSQGPGFIRQPDGTLVYFTISEPNVMGVYPASINDNGDVTGYYYPYGANSRGFVRKADGTTTTFGLPKGDNGVRGLVINSNGAVFGNYDRNKSIWYGFARQPDGTTTKLTCLSAPLYVSGANDAGQATGSDNFGGLVLNPDGSCIQFEGAYPYAINAEGSVAGITGSYPYATNFLRTPDGAITTYTIPAVYDEAFPVGINANRVIAGWFKLGVYGNSRGYIRDANGHLTIFSAGGPTITDADAKATMPAAINDAGVIVGTFVGPERPSGLAGFIRYP